MPRFLNLLLKLLLVIGCLAPIALQVDALQDALMGSALGVSLLGVLVLGWLYTAVSNAAQTEPGAFLRSGVNMVYPTASDATQDIRRLIKKASRSIKLLDTHFGHFDTLQAALGEALRRQAGLRVQIMVAEPHGWLARVRGTYKASDIADHVRSARSRIEAFQLQFDPVAEGESSRISVRSFDKTVPGPMVIIDDRHVFVGSFLQQTGSQNTPMIRMDRSAWWVRHWSNGVPDAYFQTFEALWTAGQGEPTS